MKGIKLEGTEQERNHQINNYIGELGGRKVRRKRSLFSQTLSLFFNTKRTGECYPSTKKDPNDWDDQQCFGVKEIKVKRPWGEGYDEEARISMKAKGQYEFVTHYTLTDCEEACFKKAIVVCVRTMGKSEDEYMTAHIAGECPYCNYFVRY